MAAAKRLNRVLMDAQHVVQRQVVVARHCPVEPANASAAGFSRINRRAAMRPTDRPWSGASNCGAPAGNSASNASIIARASAPSVRWFFKYSATAKTACCSAGLSSSSVSSSAVSTVALDYHRPSLAKDSANFLRRPTPSRSGSPTHPCTQLGRSPGPPSLTKRTCGYRAGRILKRRNRTPAAHEVSGSLRANSPGPRP